MEDCVIIQTAEVIRKPLEVKLLLCKGMRNCWLRCSVFKVKQNDGYYQEELWVKVSPMQNLSWSRVRVFRWLPWLGQGCFDDRTLIKWVAEQADSILDHADEIEEEVFG